MNPTFSRALTRPWRMLPATLFVILLTACTDTTRTDESAGASASASTAPSAAAASASAEASESSAGSETAAESPDEVGGIALADVDVERLLEAFEAYGFDINDEVITLDDGANRWGGYADEGQVELAIRELDGTVERVLVADYSAGEVGLDDLGFLTGIFAPEAEDWLIEQAEAAIADPGTPIEATMEFEHVTLVFEAYTDEMQSIDLYVQEK